MRDLHSLYAEWGEEMHRIHKASQFLLDHSETIDRAATMRGDFSISAEAAHYFLTTLIVLLMDEGVYLRTTKL